MLDSWTLTLTLGLIVPLAALATIVLTPFTDRKTQALLAVEYFALVAMGVAL